MRDLEGYTRYPLNYDMDWQNYSVYKWMTPGQICIPTQNAHTQINRLESVKQIINLKYSYQKWITSLEKKYWLCNLYTFKQINAHIHNVCKGVSMSVYVWKSYVCHTRVYGNSCRHLHCIFIYSLCPASNLPLTIWDFTKPY